MTDYYFSEAGLSIAVTPVFYGSLAPLSVLVYDTYQSEAPLGVYVTPSGVSVYSSAAPLSVEINGPSQALEYSSSAPLSVTILTSAGQTLYYLSSAPLKVDVQGAYSSEAPLSVILYDGGMSQGSKLTTATPDFWQVSVLMNGIDVTHACVGTVTIKCDEDAASIAEFTLLPHAGIVDPTFFTNQPVLIDFQGHRRFTGVVDTPEYDPDTTLTHFICTDGLQYRFESLSGNAIRAVGDAKVRSIQAENARNKVAHSISVNPGISPTQADGMMLAAEEKVATARNNLTKAERMTGPTVRQIVGGLWSPTVFTSNDGWDAFKDCMSTQLASYNLDSWGNGANTPWLAGTPDFTFTEDDYLDQSIKVGKIANARSIINSVDIKFEYRFTRLFEYQFQLQWAPGDPYAWCAAFGNPNNWGQNDHKRVADALNGAGFCVRTDRGLNGHTVAVGINNGLYFVPGPGPQYVILPGSAPGSNSAGYLGDSPRFSTIIAAVINVLKRYRQTVSETVIHTITAPLSISRAGRINKTVQHALESSMQPNAMTARAVDGWEEVVSDSIIYPVSKNGVAVCGGANSSGASSVVENVALQLNRYSFAHPPQAPDNTVASSLPAGVSNWDMTRNPLDGRGERDNAFATVKAVAIRSIVESHRQNEVSFTLEAHTMLELSHTARVTRSSPHFDAKGKVKSLQHAYDMDSGSHRTDVTLALIKPWSTGVHYTDPYVPLPDTGTIVYRGSLFSPTLSTWPPHDYNLLGIGPPGELEANPPDAMRFRGYNYFTSEMRIEAPPTPQEAQPVFSAVTRTSEVLSLPDDSFIIEA